MPENLNDWRNTFCFMPIGDLDHWTLSFGRDLNPLIESIKTIGLINPLIAAKTDNGTKTTIISGTRRLEALRHLGQSEVPVLFSPFSNYQELLYLALSDNQERGLNPAESALILTLAKKLLPDSEVLELAPLMNLPKSPKIFQQALLAATLPDTGLLALALGHLDLETAARLASLDSQDATALLDLFSSLKPSRQKRRQWLEWLEDIARRENLSISEILAAPFLTTKTLAPSDENALREMLWRRRHPNLALLLDQRKDLIKKLALPENLSLSMDPSLEDLCFNLDLCFRNYSELSELLDLTQKLLKNDSFHILISDNPCQ